jgi:hypothetical protein
VDALFASANETSAPRTVPLSCRTQAPIPCNGFSSPQLDPEKGGCDETASCMTRCFRLKPQYKMDISRGCSRLQIYQVKFFRFIVNAISRSSPPSVGRLQPKENAPAHPSSQVLGCHQFCLFLIKIPRSYYRFCTLVQLRITSVLYTSYPDPRLRLQILHHLPKCTTPHGDQNPAT